MGVAEVLVREVVSQTRQYYVEYKVQSLDLTFVISYILLQIRANKGVCVCVCVCVCVSILHLLCCRRCR